MEAQLLMFSSSFQGNYKMVPVSAAQRSDFPVKSKTNQSAVLPVFVPPESNLHNVKYLVLQLYNLTVSCDISVMLSWILVL